MRRQTDCNYKDSSERTGIFLHPCRRRRRMRGRSYRCAQETCNSRRWSAGFAAWKKMTILNKSEASSMTSSSASTEVSSDREHCPHMLRSDHVKWVVLVHGTRCKGQTPRTDLSLAGNGALQEQSLSIIIFCRHARTRSGPARL